MEKRCNDAKMEKEMTILCVLILMLFEIFFDEDSSCDVDVMEIIIMILNKYCLKNLILRLQDYVERILPSYTDVQFKSHFR